uniref:Serum response factor-binding protein 1 n=1 Tax=Magallana gigas TaxID=29159 RepID=A0A8W8I0M5_MAGGI
MNSESSDDEVEAKQQRNLDVATTASLDLVALNNKVISMRGQIKKVKVHVIHKLTKQIKTFQSKSRGPEKVLEKNKRKAEKLIEEVQIIKDLKPDRISKYAIGHTTSFSEVCKEPRMSLETRALARLTDHKILQDSVKEFRQDHEDWMSLAAFLMSRNSGRRIKKKSQNRVDKIITNVKAGEVLVKSFLKNRLEGDEDELEKIVNLNAVKKKSDNSKEEPVECVAKPVLPVDGKGSDMESDLSDEESDECLDESDESDEIPQDFSVETHSESRTSDDLPDSTTKSLDKSDEGEDEDEGSENSRLQGDDAEDSDEEEELERGKHAFRSTFMGSLSEKDWRKSTKERNHGNMKGPTAPGSSSNFQKSRKGRDFPKKLPKQSKQFKSKDVQSGSKKDTEEKLHPSWIASKKRKEQAQIQIFQGKKIKFDD